MGENQHYHAIQTRQKKKNKSRMRVKFSCDTGMSVIHRCTEKETDLRRRKGNKRYCEVKRGENLKEDGNGERDLPAETTVTRRRLRRKTVRGENGEMERKRREKMSSSSEDVIYRRRRTVERESWRGCNQRTVPSYPVCFLFFLLTFTFNFWQLDTV